VWSLSIQQEIAAGEVRETTFQESLQATRHDAELLDVSIRSVILFHRLLLQSQEERTAKVRPLNLPVSITAIQQVQAPSWMMRLAWVPSSTSRVMPKPSMPR